MTLRSIRSPRRLAATSLALLALAACGGDDDTAEPPTTSAAVPNTPPPTVLPTATTPPSSTLPAPTTQVPSPDSTTPSTSAPSTSSPDIDEAKAAVIAAAENAWYLFNEAKLDPTNDEKVQAALAAQIEGARARTEQVLADYAAANQRSVTFELAPASVSVLPDSVQIDPSGTTAHVETCQLNSNVLVTVSGNPDGSDHVLDDTIMAVHTREIYSFVEGSWLKRDGQVLETFEGALTCDDRG